MGLVESRPGEVLSRTVWSRWLLKQAWPGMYVRQTLSVNFKITALEAVTITVTVNDHFTKFTVTDNHQQKQEETKYVCFVVLRAEPKAPRTS